MPFDNSTFSESTSDPRYDLLKKSIKVDKDSKAYEMQFIPPATAKGSFTAPATGNLLAETQQCWNSDGSMHYFDVFCGSDFKTNFQGCGILVRYFARQGRLTNAAAFWGRPISSFDANGDLVGPGTSVPWNPLWWVQTASLKVNQSQTPIEQYVSQGLFQHVTTPRFILKYKQALETNDSTLLTPCIESKFDNSTISSESARRAELWLGASDVEGAAANPDLIAPKYFTKFIPLSDIFECCESPAIFTNVTRFRVEFTFRTPDTIAFRCGIQANATPTYFYIDDIKLVYDCTRMQAEQAVETAIERKEGKVENIGFVDSFPVPIAFNNGSQLVVTGQRDVQSVIALFPMLGRTYGGAGGAVTNPIQYDSGLLTSITMMYGPDLPFRTPIKLNGTAGGARQEYENVMAYELYRKASGAERCNLVTPALTFEKFRQYHMYFLPIYHPSMVHRNADPRDIRVDVSGGPGAMTAYIVVRKFNGCQIQASGAVDKL